MFGKETLDDAQRSLSYIRRHTTSMKMVDRVLFIEEAYADLKEENKALKRNLEQLRPYSNAMNEYRREIEQAAIQAGWRYDMTCTALEFLKGEK